jgi:hypothetical protein
MITATKNHAQRICKILKKEKSMINMETFWITAGFPRRFFYFLLP